jgi:hypothetical protein
MYTLPEIFAAFHTNIQAFGFFYQLRLVSLITAKQERKWIKE